MTQSFGAPLRPPAPVSLRPPTKIPLSNVPQGTANTTTTFTRVKKRITQRIAPPVNLPMQPPALASAPDTTSATPAHVSHSAPSPSAASATALTERTIQLPMDVALASLPMTALLEPQENLLAKPEASQGISIPLMSVFGMVPTGKVEFPFKDFAAYFPPGFLKPAGSLGEDEQTLCRLPLAVVVSAMPSELFQRRQDQKPIDKKIVEMADPFTFNTPPSPSPLAAVPQEATHSPEAIVSETSTAPAPVEEANVVMPENPTAEIQAPSSESLHEAESQLPPTLSEASQLAVEPGATRIPVPEMGDAPVAEESPAKEETTSGEPDFSFARNEAFKALLAEQEAEQTSTPASAVPEEPIPPAPESPRISVQIVQPPPSADNAGQPFKPSETATIRVREIEVQPDGGEKVRDSFAKELLRLAEREKETLTMAMMERGTPFESQDQLPPMEMPPDESTAVVKLRKSDVPPAPVESPVALPQKSKPADEQMDIGLIPIKDDLPTSSVPVVAESKSLPASFAKDASPINLNACGEQELIEQAACPDALARKIVAWRELYGPFSESSALWHVPGMTSEVYGSLIGLPSADHVVSQELQDVFGGSPSDPLTVKSIASRIRHWPFMTGCIIGGMEGLPIAYDCDDEDFAKTICAFLPRLIARTNETLSEIKEPETDEIFICKGDKSLFLFRSGPVLLLAVNRRKDIPARDAELLRRVTAYLGEMNQAKVTT